MQIRLLLLIPFTLFSLFMMTMELNYGDQLPIASGLLTLAGLYGIWYALWYEINFKPEDGYLIIDAPLRSAERFHMEDLIAWQDYGHNIRAQQRKTMILFFAESKKVVLDNSEYKNEFEALLLYMKKAYSLKSQNRQLSNLNNGDWTSV